MWLQLYPGYSNFGISGVNIILHTNNKCEKTKDSMQIMSSIEL